MLRGLFGRGGRDKKESRAEVSHAWDLRPGDFLKLGLAAPEGLSGAELQVTAVHAVDFGGPGKVRRVLTLDGGGNRYTMWRDDGDRIAIGREILRATVERVFDIDEFARLFDPDEPANLTLERAAEPPELDGWTGAVYRQEGAQQAYRHDQDPAVDADLAGNAPEFDHYRLVGDQRRYAVEVSVYDGGRTDVTLVVLATESIVDELWPA